MKYSQLTHANFRSNFVDMYIAVSLSIEQFSELVKHVGLT